MTNAAIVEWCALGAGPCWTRGEWITLWASFGGVFIAFLLGVATQFLSQRRKSKNAVRFLDVTLRNSIEAISFFDNEYRKFGDEDQIGNGFGGLGHAAAAIKWASAHPGEFEPSFFIRLLKIQQRVIGAGEVGPSQFAWQQFILDASTYLSRTVPPVASDIRFLLQIPEADEEEE